MLKIRIVSEPAYSQSSLMPFIASKDAIALEYDPGENWEPKMVLIRAKNRSDRYENLWIDIRDIQDWGNCFQDIERLSINRFQ